MKIWAIIEHDRNRGHIFDIVTTEYAQDLHIGQKVIVVCADHDKGRMDDGYAFFARITRMRPVVGEPESTIVWAERVKQRWPLETRVWRRFLK